ATAYRVSRATSALARTGAPRLLFGPAELGRANVHAAIRRLAPRATARAAGRDAPREGDRPEDRRTPQRAGGLGSPRGSRIARGRECSRMAEGFRSDDPAAALAGRGVDAGHDSGPAAVGRCPTRPRFLRAPSAPGIDRRHETTRGGVPRF